jgi:hypothetical protein
MPAVVLLVLGLLLAPAAARAQDEPPAGEPVLRTCPGTFHVLHDDRIGRVAFPAGAYRLSTRNLVCPEASRFLTGFLADWDGVLPRPWRLSRTRTFTAGTSASAQSFTARRLTSSAARRCPDLTNPRRDRIGNLQLPSGRYAVTLLGRGTTCAEAARSFFELLYAAGTLPAPWRLTVSGTAAGELREPLMGISFAIRRRFSGTDGAGTSPPRGERPCGIFRVGNDDPIGRSFLVRKGPYHLTVFGSVSCPGAVRALQVLLARRDGVLPRPWRLRAQSGSFTRGTGTANGLRLDRALGSG